jgi:hypothetical protein
MKKAITLLAVLAILAAAPSAFGAGNTFPFPNQMWGVIDGVGIDDQTFPLQQGWFEGQLAWYIPVIGAAVEAYDSGALGFQANLDLDYRYRYPLLSSAIGSGAGLMYIVQNFQQGPVFSAAPGQADYSGIWQVVYIKWKPGAAKRPIISDLDLPSGSEATFSFSDLVVDRPIVALGQLGGPWFPGPPGTYRLPQVTGYDPIHKAIELPAWYVYGQDTTTKQPLIGAVIIPDVADPTLAAILKANVAPGLAAVDPANVQKFWVQDWTILPPVPPLQLPIVERSDNLLQWVRKTETLKHNFEFTPVMDFTLLMRTGLPPYVVVNNPTLLQNLLPPFGSGFAVEGSPSRINAPMLISIQLKNVQIIIDGDNHDGG